MANQEKCKQALEDIAQQANQIFSYRPPATYEEAIQAAEEVAAKQRKRLAENDRARKEKEGK